jgi:hypothetical protein
MFSIVAKLTSEFTSLDEPTDDSDIAIVAVLLADGSDFVESNPKIRRESLGFRSSDPSLDPGLRRLE